jgi:hypothetical protein
MIRLESDYDDWIGSDPERARGGLRHCLPWFVEGPVLQLACGRGEFLDLLREAGEAAVDVDEGMVAAGHEVQLTDALAGLRSRLRATQQELADRSRSYAQLLAELYPPNEVDGVARVV